MRKLLFGAVALVLFGACSKKDVEISGEFKGLADTKAVLNKIEAGRPSAIDSVDAKDGKFLFKLPKTDAQLFLVTFEGKEEPVAFFGGDEDVTLTGSADDFSKVVADGSDMTALFEKFNNEIPKQARSKALRGEYAKAQMGGDTAVMMALRNEYESISQEQKAYFDKFLDENTNNAVGAFMALNMAAGLESAKVKELVVKFEKALKNHPYVAELKKMIQAMDEMEKMQAEQAKAAENIKVGNAAPDFSLKTTEGKDITLASFKGKYLLIDFWASWCAPCREENPNMVKVFEKFSKKGLQMLSISTDEDDAKWLEAVAADKLGWAQARDFDGGAAQKYAISQIPTTFLLDPNGVIVEINLRGEELTKKLTELIK